MDNPLKETLARLDQLLDDCLNAKDQTTLCIDFGIILGTLTTLIELNVVKASVVQNYNDQIEHLIGLYHLGVILENDD